MGELTMGELMKRLATTGLKRTVMAGLMMTASLAAIERAYAACAPTSPVNNATVTCTGTTTNQNDPDGYGTATDAGNTINVQAGASVTGTNAGLIMNIATVNNDGSVSGSTFGVRVFNDLTLNNTGLIQATGNSPAIEANGASIANAQSGKIMGVS